MKIKSDWEEYLHKIRKDEIKLIFRNCHEKFLREGLELGAGDGFQSQLLTKCVFHLIATDYDLNRLCRSDSKQITYMKCDAEKVGYSFGPRQFDFIFSSSLLEHLPHPKKALIGIHKVLKDDGITIHCMPNSFWKFTQIFMFYSNLFMNIFERLTTPGWLRGFIEKQKKEVLNYLA